MNRQPDTAAVSVVHRMLKNVQPKFELLGILKGPPICVLSVYVSPDGTRLAPGSSDNTIKYGIHRMEKFNLRRLIGTPKVLIHYIITSMDLFFIRII